MALRKVYGPFTILGLDSDMVYGSNLGVHLVLRVYWRFHQPGVKL